MLKTLREWIGGTRTGPRVSSKEIRQRQAATAHWLAALTTEAQDLALPELEGDAVAATRRAALHHQIAEYERDRDTLTGALASALAREHEADRREYARLAAELRQVLAELEQARDAMLATLTAEPLPTLDAMHALRVLSKECGELAYAVEAATGERVTHLDALAELRSRMAERHGAFEHRWLQTRPTAKPDFSGRPWRRTVEALRRLAKEAA